MLAATRAQSFVQALRFSYFVLGFKGSLDAASSRRVCGAAEIQLASKKPTVQARPLTVQEVCKLHSISADPRRSLADRVIASSLLLALYGRCRVSDLAHVHEILHDDKSGSGFVQISTVHHKSSRAPQNKSLLLPIVISSVSVVEVPWVVHWVRNRKEAGLPVSGALDSTLLPVPSGGKDLTWNPRQLTTSEVTNILRSLLGNQDPLLRSHSLKAIVLSWCAKCEVLRDHRRLLGRHSSSIKDSDSFYARDLLFAPVRSLERVLNLIRAKQFLPDEPRSNFFPELDNNPLVSSTPMNVSFMPKTPVFPHAAVHDLQTQASVGNAGDEIDKPSVKLEDGHWSLPSGVGTQTPIEISSTSSSNMSSSASSDAISDEQEFEQTEHVSETPCVPTVESLCMSASEAFLRLKHSVIVHGCKADRIDGTQCEEAILANLRGKTTECGRVVDQRFLLVPSISDWTTKCRICFRGRREPVKASAL